MLKDCGKSVFILALLLLLVEELNVSAVSSAYTHGSSPHAEPNNSIVFIQNFSLFWDHGSLFRKDEIHPNKQDSQMLL